MLSFSKESGMFNIVVILFEDQGPVFVETPLFILCLFFLLDKVNKYADTGYREVSM
ncbi:hypothetical protein SAMN04489735_10193 [Aneurinibacillus thermoaerophilus]|uniref:Uncharacterized protein n=1 Tax=Aneurinibacillus thermoaerophilus TaxID=143495 RepID=A0A1G8BCC2_ANETH|nr:hypothetical protein SAMN04489735_10193 [Aneurinibacillus thermoaerophilus]